MRNWWIDSDNLIRLTGLKDALTGEYINDAAVTAALADDQAVAVEGAEQITLDYVAESQGDYAGLVPHGAALTEGRQYTLTITAASADCQLVLKITARAAYKGP